MAIETILREMIIGEARVLINDILGETIQRVVETKVGYAIDAHQRSIHHHWMTPESIQELVDARVNSFFETTNPNIATGRVQEMVDAAMQKHYDLSAESRIRRIADQVYEERYATRDDDFANELSGYLQGDREELNDAISERFTDKLEDTLEGSRELERAIRNVIRNELTFHVSVD
jgi:hypothetical protein